MLNRLGILNFSVIVKWMGINSKTPPIRRSAMEMAHNKTRCESEWAVRILLSFDPCIAPFIVCQLCLQCAFMKNSLRHKFLLPIFFQMLLTMQYNDLWLYFTNLYSKQEIKRNEGDKRNTNETALKAYRTTATPLRWFSVWSWCPNDS